MIIWNTNLSLDQQQLKETIAAIKSNKKNSTTENYYTTYFTQSILDREEIVFVDQYKKTIGEAMIAMSLYHRCDYVFDHWMQVYPGGNDGHAVHDHYMPTAIISWVHFVEPSKTSCFYFIDSMGNRIYPKQEAGDFIVFSPWQLHGVDGFDGDCERVVIAGNVYAKKIYSPDNGKDLIQYEHKQDGNFTIKSTGSYVNGTLDWEPKKNSVV